MLQSAERKLALASACAARTRHSSHKAYSPQVFLSLPHQAARRGDPGVIFPRRLRSVPASPACEPSSALTLPLGTLRPLGCRAAAARTCLPGDLGEPLGRGPAGAGRWSCRGERGGPGRGHGRRSRVGLLPVLAQTNAPPSPGSREPRAATEVP